jgi:hypothetical protein
VQIDWWWTGALPLLLAAIPALLVRPWLRDDQPMMIGRWGLALVAVHGVWLAGCMLLPTIYRAL